MIPDRTFLAVMTCALCACATVHPSVDVRFSQGIDESAATGAVHTAFADLDAGQQVKVEDATVTQIDTTKYDVLGAVAIDQVESGSLRWRNWIWTHDYESGHMFGYCVWQVPLKMVTLGIWNVTPFAWPCLAGNPDSVQGRMAYLLRYVRSVTRAMGGDVALLTSTVDGTAESTSGVSFMPVRNVPIVIGGSQTQMESVHATGLRFTVLKKK